MSAANEHQSRETEANLQFKDALWADSGITAILVEVLHYNV